MELFGDQSRQVDSMAMAAVAKELSYVLCGDQGEGDEEGRDRMPFSGDGVPKVGFRNFEISQLKSEISATLFI